MRELKKIEEGKYRLMACLQSTGSWDDFPYPNHLVRDVFLLTDGQYFIPRYHKHGTHLFLLVNNIGNESIWSGDLLAEKEVIVKKMVWSSETEEGKRW